MRRLDRLGGSYNLPFCSSQRIIDSFVVLPTGVPFILQQFGASSQFPFIRKIFEPRFGFFIRLPGVESQPFTHFRLIGAKSFV